jgi:hypothetical protein
MIGIIILMPIGAAILVALTIIIDMIVEIFTN